MKKPLFAWKVGAVVLTAALTVPVGPGAAFAESASEGSLDWGDPHEFQ